MSLAEVTQKASGVLTGTVLLGVLLLLPLLAHVSWDPVHCLQLLPHLRPCPFK